MLIFYAFEDRKPGIHSHVCGARALYPTGRDRTVGGHRCRTPKGRTGCSCSVCARPHILRWRLHPLARSASERGLAAACVERCMSIRRRVLLLLLRPPAVVPATASAGTSA